MCCVNFVRQVPSNLQIRKLRQRGELFVQGLWEGVTELSACGCSRQHTTLLAQKASNQLWF